MIVDCCKRVRSVCPHACLSEKRMTKNRIVAVHHLLAGTRDRTQLRRGRKVLGGPNLVVFDYSPHKKTIKNLKIYLAERFTGCGYERVREREREGGEKNRG